MSEFYKRAHRGRTMLIIDNYDSFTYNIVQYIKILGIDPIVVNNDELSLNDIKKLKFSKILLSPGWGNPDNSGVTMEVIDFYKDIYPILGVCLGMQCIAKYFGADIIKLKEPFHGKNSQIYFEKDFELFKDIPQEFSATRYHSLMVSNIKSPVELKAKTKDDIPMAIKIKNKNIYGVQFHPEAILSEYGLKIFDNFIKISE